MVREGQDAGASSENQPDHGAASLELLRQRVAELQHLATEAERGRERAIAEACVLQQQRDFFHASTKEALDLVAAITESTKFSVYNGRCESAGKTPDQTTPNRPL